MPIHVRQMETCQNPHWLWT